MTIQMILLLVAAGLFLSVTCIMSIMIVSFVAERHAKKYAAFDVENCRRELEKRKTAVWEVDT